MTREEEKIKLLRQTMDQNWELQKKLMLKEGISPTHEIIKYLENQLSVMLLQHSELTARKSELVRVYRALGGNSGENGHPFPEQSRQSFRLKVYTPYRSKVNT